MQLSVIIVTKNEEHDIRDCLESIKWADEIIVVDSGSKDKTLDICKQYTNKIYRADWNGYGKQKNIALEKAVGKWILSIDADEKVADALSAEIKQAILADKYTAYAIPFRSSFCGNIIKYGAWRNESHIRLFKKSCGRFKENLVHEGLVIDGKIGKLKTPILHLTYKNLEEVLTKINHYSTLGAQQKQREKEQSSFCKAIMHGFWAFLRTYILQFGFFDGKAGFMLAISVAEATYYKYLKLSYLSREY